MISYVVTSLALFGATVSAGSCGSAHVVNQCSYDVYVQNTPSSGGGYTQIDTVLKAGNNYTQEYTALSNDNGWSMKISKTEGAFQSNILQYEYTYQTADTSIVWFDLSCVNGDPFEQDWLISADSPNGNCDPSQQPYTYPTEDKVVPEVSQSCSSDNTIILTLCHSNSNSGSNSGSGSASSSSSHSSHAVASSPAASSQAVNTPAASSQAAASYAAPPASASLGNKAEHAQGAAEYNWNNADASASEAVASPSPTTFATVTTAGPGEVIVTDVKTAIVTNIVTAYAGRVKPRHEHHAHGHQHHA